MAIAVAQADSRSMVSEWYRLLVAMTLRLTDEESAALRKQAEKEGRSMQDVARSAVRDYIERDAHRFRVVASAATGAKQYAEALRRLGE